MEKLSKKHDEVVYCLYGLLEENNSVNIALLKNDYNKLKKIVFVL